MLSRARICTSPASIERRTTITMSLENTPDQHAVPAAVGAVIASYDPGENLRSLVATLRSSGVEVRVVDDASPSPRAAALLDELEADGVTVLRKQRNSGIGASLNIGVSAALEAGHSFVLTLDQDSSLDVTYVAQALAEFERLERAGHRPGLVAPASNSAEAVRGLLTTVDGFLTCRFPIQSGSIFPAEALRRTGSFREDFVMDAIDHDYALRLRAAGYDVYAAADLDLTHTLGAPADRTWLGKPVVVSNHSRPRQYYQFRNRIVLLREHWRTDPSWCRELAVAHVREARRILFFEKGRARSFGLIVRASFAGLLGRTGPR